MDSSRRPFQDPLGTAYFSYESMSYFESQVPHEVQMIMATKKLPSLCGMIPMIEIFMMCWEELCNKEPHLKCFIQPGLKYAIKYYHTIDKSPSYTISMCKSYLYVSGQTHILYCS